MAKHTNLTFPSDSGRRFATHGNFAIWCVRKLWIALVNIQWHVVCRHLLNGYDRLGASISIKCSTSICHQRIVINAFWNMIYFSNLVLWNDTYIYTDYSLAGNILVCKNGKFTSFYFLCCIHVWTIGMSQQTYGYGYEVSSGGWSAY